MTIMKNRLFSRFFVSLLIFCAGVSGSYAQQYHNGLIDKTVALVGADAITIAEIEMRVQMLMYGGYTMDKNIRCVALEEMLLEKLYLNQAKVDSLQANPAEIDRQLNATMDNILTRYGGKAGAEEYFGKNIFRIREGYRERITENTLMQMMQQNVTSKVPELTPDQVRRFYQSISKDSLPIVPEQYKLSQIVLLPDKEQANLKIKERLLEYRKRVMDGSSFEMLATLYSDDASTAMRGGELGMTSKSLFVPSFSDAAMSLKEGQVSPIVETPFGFHLIKMIKKNGDMFNARHILLKPKYTVEDRMKAFTRLDSIRTAIMGDSISFFDAARKFSQDESSKTNGGLLSETENGSVYFDKEKLNPIDYNYIKNLKPGEISQPFESVDKSEGADNTVYKIVKLDEIKPSHQATFKDDFSVIQNLAKNIAYMKAIEEFEREKIKETYIVIDPMFYNCEFERSGWIK